MSEAPSIPTARFLELPQGKLETFTAPHLGDATPIVAAHPASTFSGDSAFLLSNLAERTAICINPRGLGGSAAVAETSIEEMIDDLEAARLSLELDPWIFWGMSGGGWLALAYAHRHPTGLRGMIVESACACFRQRLADPTCALSPFFPAWQEPLKEHGCLSPGSHDEALPANDAIWEEIEGVGQVFRRKSGPALLVSPAPIEPSMRRAMPMLWDFDARDWLSQIQTPSLVISGQVDPVVPSSQVRQVHESLPNSSFVEIAGAGHVPSSTGNEAARDAVRQFLKTLP